jgi:hypothetical protein
MRFLLTSAGIKNASIHDALVDLLGKPIPESLELSDSERVLQTSEIDAFAGKIDGWRRADMSRTSCTRPSSPATRRHARASSSSSRAGHRAAWDQVASAGRNDQRAFVPEAEMK